MVDSLVDPDIDTDTTRGDTNGSPVKNGEIVQAEPTLRVVAQENLEKPAKKRKSSKSTKKGSKKVKVSSNGHSNDVSVEA